MHFKDVFFRIGCVALLCIPMTFSGCSSKAPEQENVIIVEKEEESIDYNLTVVTRGDVLLTEKVKCTYTQLNEQDVSFSVSGRRVSRVYVEEGDTVKKGQLLAELSTDNLDSRIAELEYKIARNTLLLEQLYEMQEQNVGRVELQYSEISDIDDPANNEIREKKEEDIAEVREKDTYSIEDYEDAISLDTMELEQLKAEQASSCVYAGMDGIVADIKERLEGSTSVQGDTILRIIDDSECIFSVTDTKYRDYILSDTAVSMSITYGKGSGQYELLPYRYDNWTDTMLFSIVEQPDSAILEVGDTGSIDLILDERTDVLTLPASAIHTADGMEYVYILNEDNLREVKWIETGLHGNTTVEILSNLEEGDKVFLQ